VKIPSGAPPLLVFADLDGTLLDSAFSAAKSEACVRHAMRRGVPVVLCSAKTLAEVRPIRTELCLEGVPCIGENGSVVFWPDGTLGHLDVFGLPARDIRDRLDRIVKRAGIQLTGYGSLEPEQVAAITGLSPASARLAMSREYSETLVDAYPASVWQNLEPEFRREGLVCWPGGRFHTVTGSGADKGRAVRWVTDQYERSGGRALTTVGVGDSANDLPMLGAVVRAYLVQRPGGIWEEMSLPRLHRVPAVGPIGFSQVMGSELAGLGRD